MIAEKLGIDRAFSFGLVNLIEQGEESLVEHVEAGRLPISVAVEIARGNDHSVSLALSEAYQTGQLRGAKAQNGKATDCISLSSRKEYRTASRTWEAFHGWHAGESL